MSNNRFKAGIVVVGVLEAAEIVDWVDVLNAKYPNRNFNVFIDQLVQTSLPQQTMIMAAYNKFQIDALSKAELLAPIKDKHYYNKVMAYMLSGKGEQ